MLKSQNDFNEGDMLKYMICLLLLIIVGPIGADDPRKEPLAEIGGERSKPLILKRPATISTNGEFLTSIVKISNDKLSLRLLRWEHPNKLDTIWYSGDEKLHEVRLSEALAAGQMPRYYKTTMSPEVSQCYRRGDVKVGDIIVYGSQIIDGSEECMFLQILRRPGGAIPVAPGDEDSKNSPYHMRMQNEQNFEAKGTPILEKWGGKKREKELSTRMKQIKAILETAEKNEKDKKK